MQLPKLTRSLRAFTKLEGDPVEIEKNDIIAKQKEYTDKIREGPSWTDFYNRVPKDLAQSLLRLFHKIQLKLDGMTAEAMKDLTIHILRLLVNDHVLTQKNAKILKQLLGEFTPQYQAELMKIIQEIRENISQEDLQYLNNMDNDNKAAVTSKSKLFGTTIPYVAKKVAWPNVDMLHPMGSEKDVDLISAFTMNVESIRKIDPSSEFNKADLIQMLRNCYQKFSDEMPYEQFVKTILTKLKEPEDNLGSDLIDFVGYENVSLVEYLVKNKKHILAMSTAKKVNKVFKKFSEFQQQPTIACQVTVQTEKQKQLFKQVRKEEKKLQKAAKSDPSSSKYESNDLRLLKKEAVNSLRAPLFSSVRKYVPHQAPQEKYPFVFDSKLSIKNSAGFISGQKLLLPENVEKKDSKLCEEVHIPLPDTTTDLEETPRVSVSILDEVGQTAFSGIETLNRIQSIVFESAYYTNENLLICAPTGAGKTNIAMLSVVHELKMHMVNGVLQKDEFKIIYVAPMKALAAEMATNFSRRLGKLGVSVRELTGDIQLTKSEIQETQMIITTPEKWDVVTRKGTGDIALTSIVRLLIIDEVHLLHGDRGPVVEALVARTLRQVESSQSMIRIVGLSATLPNYVDVARFLRVNPYKGLFYFDHRFRPVPLSQTFIGVKAVKPMQQMTDMDLVCYNQVVEMVKQKHQVMVFVHARNATVRLANTLKEMFLQNETIKYLMPDERSVQNRITADKLFSKSHNKVLGELFAHGLSVHHAGLLRADRNLVEKYFAQGAIKVLICTSTLAWGVNLPAHAVIIRGTEIYDSKHGSFMDLGILDVLQIFGRAGRPQFDTSGHAVIITSHNKLSHYLSLLTNQVPIESSFITYLADNLNAEIALGTISNVNEAVEWLSYTYLFVRMRLNFMNYGIQLQTLMEDPMLERKRKELIITAASALDKARMIRYNKNTGDLSSLDLGRIASHFYLKYDTIEIFNNLFKPVMTEVEILGMVSHSQEFEQLKVRDEEMDELENLLLECCELKAQGGVENVYGKVNILIQTYLSRGRLKAFSLISDQAYVSQNVVRIFRALFEIVLRRNNAIMASRLLQMSKMMELQQWDHFSPLRQFYCLPHDIIYKIEDRNIPVEKLKEMTRDEIGRFLNNQKSGDLVKKCCHEIPCVEVETILQPITRTVLRIRIQIYPQFKWNDKVHGKKSEAFWIWVEDPESNMIYHYEYLQMTRKMVYNNLAQELVMTIPLTEPLPTQYIIRVTNDRWLGSETAHPFSIKDLILPETHPPHTDLLELQPLPVSVLKDQRFEKLYRFSHFNLIQTQIFHCLYHTDNNVLLGAPTGSGKTIAAEIAMMRVFKNNPELKVVYIAPLKALARERMKDWKVRFEQDLGKKVVELTGDVSPDLRSIMSASVIITTPEKWDGISRSWQTRNYVKQVALIVIDEIHLLGEDRGPVLEVIVSRTNFIASHTQRTLRIVGLSTALANAIDLAEWLGIKKMGLYNFRPSVRPVPLEVHISGFPGKHYCPRMATMNRPTFQAIKQHAPGSPSLVFVSSRRQTRLTALDLIAYLAAEDNPKQWLHIAEDDMENILQNIKDQHLKLTLAFGIGLHHAGLQDKDRKTVEELFVNNMIQVLITTATLAWGVNFPAHLVVIKGTEYYDGKLKRYVDMPITDVLQMIGRAGRPQFDDSGVAVVLVHDVKKPFYKKFLYEPFPVESSLLDVLPDHINAEIVAGTVKNKQEFLDYLTWTYFFRRLLKNPTYYGLEILEPENINGYLSQLVDATLKDLVESQCVYVEDDEQTLVPLPMGRIASFYYLSHKTALMFEKNLKDDLPLEVYLRIMCTCHEYDELPVRHNEDLLNEELSKMCRYQVDDMTYDSSNTKAFLLLQAHFSRLPMPCSDYVTDLKSVLDQSIRILQAMIDVVAERGWLIATLRVTQILQMVIQARWFDDPALITLPNLEREHLPLFAKAPKCLPEFCTSVANNYKKLSSMLMPQLTESEVYQILQAIKEFPILCVGLTIQSSEEEEELETILKLNQGSKQVVEVRRNRDYTLIVGTTRKNKTTNLKAHCPIFQKGKDEGWFLVLGDIERRELLALRRVSGVNGPLRNNQLMFTAPSVLGETVLTFYLISDCYIGMDQQYEIRLNVVE